MIPVAREYRGFVIGAKTRSSGRSVFLRLGTAVTGAPAGRRIRTGAGRVIAAVAI